MPGKTQWSVDISINNRIAGNIHVFAETAEAAEDFVAGLVKLSASKVYKKGQENEETENPAPTPVPAA